MVVESGVIDNHRKVAICQEMCTFSQSLYHTYEIKSVEVTTH